jgi:glutathione S-transferase
MNEALTLFYHPNSSGSRVVWLFLLENHIQCKLELVNLFQSEQNSPAFLELNPAGTVPTLVDGRFVLHER